MSWTDVFPYFGDEGLEAFDAGATEPERENLAGLFRVADIINSKPARHVVSASLFWKPMVPSDEEVPALTKELLRNPAAYGLVARQDNPWEYYVEPLLDGARILTDAKPDVAFRVYLANDMAFAIPELVAAGCEVYLMESSSIGMQPGMMWRFLALEHEGLVTVTDSDRAREVIYDVERTQLVAEAGLAHWRVAYTCGREETRRALPTHYRPILACHFGSALAYPMEHLMAAFLWNCGRGEVATEISLGPEMKKAIMGTQWPDYGFDEWFLQTAFYPRMVFHGVLTFVPWNDRKLNQWFALDIEYCTWANPKSEILYHGEPVVDREDLFDPGEFRLPVNAAEIEQPA